MLAATALLLAVQSAPAADGQRQALFETFRQVCFEGQGQLPAGSARPARFQDLPGAAKKALNLLNPVHFQNPVARFRTALTGAREIAASIVPNEVYRLEGRGRAWLLTPAPAAETRTLGQQCIVIWEGRDYAAAAHAQNLWLGIRTDTFPPAIMPENLGWADASFEGQWVVAASLGNWTLLSALPSNAPGAPH